MKVGFLRTNLFRVKFNSKLLKFFSRLLWVMIVIAAILFFLSGICIKFLIEILFFEKAFVIED